MLKSIKAHWKRAVSGLLAVVMAAGMLSDMAFDVGAVSVANSDYAPTGDFELNVAGSTGWNGTRFPLPVYADETSGAEIVTVPASDDAEPVPFIILRDNGGDRVQIGLVGDADGNVIAWDGGVVDGTGWVDKEYIFVNLPDVLPSIAYNLTNASGSIFAAMDGKEIPGVTGKEFYPQALRFNGRLNRQEYIVPCMYTLAERLAKVQKSAMSNGDTLVVYETFRPAAVQSAVRDGLRSLIASDSAVSADMKRAKDMGYGESWFIASGTSNHQAGLAVDVSLAKGDASTLREYEINGATYWKYGAWTEYEMPSRMHELASAAIRYKSPVDSYSMPSKLENWTDTFAASEGAKRLQNYCTTAGLIPLSSEWWHFNDPNAAKIMAKGAYSKDTAVNTKGDYTFDRADSVAPQTALTLLVPGAVPLDGTGGYNPGTAGGNKPASSNVSWSTLTGRTFLRFTLIEFPKGVVTDLNRNDTWQRVGTPLNVVWSKDSGGTTYDGEYVRTKITWYNSNAMRYNAYGENGYTLMAGSSVTHGVYSYDANSGHNKRWVMTADEFQAATGISDYEKSQMFNLSASDWSDGWTNGDYTSMWGTDPHPVTPGNLYTVYKPNKAFLYLLNRLSEQDAGADNPNPDIPGWSEEEAIANWSSFVYDDDGNLRTKYRIIVEPGVIITDPDGYRRAYTLRDMMAYTLYNNEGSGQYTLIYDQASTIKNMAQWMRQAITQFVEYPLDASGVPTGEELFSTDGFTECDSFVDSISYAREIRDAIFSERRSFGLHIFSPFNFESDQPDKSILEVTKKVKISNLEVLNAVLYVVENGRKWRRLPKEHGDWPRDLCPGEPLGKKGVLQAAFLRLQQLGIIQIQVDVVSLDSTRIKVHPDGMGTKKTVLSPSAKHGTDGTPNFIWSPHLIEMR